MIGVPGEKKERLGRDGGRRVGKVGRESSRACKAVFCSKSLLLAYKGRAPKRPSARTQVLTSRWLGGAIELARAGVVVPSAAPGIAQVAVPLPLVELRNLGRENDEARGRCSERRRFAFCRNEDEVARSSGVESGHVLSAVLAMGWERKRES
jgi:hypothetical protein